MRILIICLILLIGATASRQEGILGKRARSYSDDDHSMESGDSLETHPGVSVARISQMTPRLALIHYFSHNPHASMGELNDFLLPLGMPLQFEALANLRESLFGMAKIPTWLHNLLMISQDSLIAVPLLRGIGPVQFPLPGNDYEVRLKIQLWNQFCIRPLRVFERLSMLERRLNTPPCHPLIGARGGEGEWTLSIEMTGQMFAALFTIESQLSS
jgi:hypothetical protein